MQMDEKMSDYTVILEHLVELPRTQEGVEWLAKKRKHYLNLRLALLNHYLVQEYNYFCPPPPPPFI